MLFGQQTRTQGFWTELYFTQVCMCLFYIIGPVNSQTSYFLHKNRTYFALFLVRHVIKARYLIKASKAKSK
jgi:hypothetical protein